MNGKNLAQSVWSGHRVGWLIVILTGVFGLWLIFIWFNHLIAIEVAWLWLTTVTLTGGILFHLYQRRRLKLTVCSVKPQVGPLQVSCLSAQALGVQLLGYTASPDFVAALPFLAWPDWPYVCILSSVAGLGWLSFFCDCRDELLRGLDA
jgi:hypothetical protein